MTARSAVLGRASAASATVAVLYVAQPGYTTLVKSVAVENDGSVADLVVVWAEDPTASVFATVFRGTLETLTAELVSTWVVMVPGDRIRARIGAGCSVWISGSILQGVQPVQPPLLITRPGPSPLPG